MRSLLRPIVVAGAVVLVAAACGGDDDATPTTVIDTIAPATSAPSDSPGVPDEPGADESTDPAVELVDTGLELEAPIAMVALPGSDQLLVAERAGVVRAVAPTGSDVRLEVVGDPVVDVSELVGSTDGERGLLGIATDAAGDALYVSYTEASEGASRVDEYRLERPAQDAPRAVASSRRELLAVPQPFSNHNGGHVVLAPDGSLLVGLGDGGSADDPGGRSQDPDTLLGKMVRVDPDVQNEPGENRGAEIHAIGVRNPWRFSFDRATGDLWVADVGQNRFEEITVLGAERDAPGEDAAGDTSDDTSSDPAASRARTVAGEGANLGWDLFEGDEPFDEADPDPRTSDGPFVDPVFTYDRDAGCSITGGVVYRGDEAPALDGWYLFGDFCDPAIRALRPVDDRDASTAEGTASTSDGGSMPTRDDVTAVDLGVELGGTVSFAEDADGEVYVLSLEGTVARLVAAR